MSTEKVSITIEQATLTRLDHLVERRVFPSRSNAIQQAISDKLERVERRRLVRECAKLDPKFEKALAEEGMSLEPQEWPEY